MRKSSDCSGTDRSASSCAAICLSRAGHGSGIAGLACDSHTFPEESRYADPVYAERAYRLFVRDLQMSTTTRACIFATIHADATLLLMQLLEETGLVAMVGKVNMDMNSPESYCETTDGSLAETERWIRESLCRYKNVSPILTPRFAPVCSGRLMASLGRLQQKYALP